MTDDSMRHAQYLAETLSQQLQGWSGEKFGLAARRQVVPNYMDGMPGVAWVIGNENGVVTFHAAIQPRQGPYITFPEILGVPWDGILICAHRPVRRDEFEADNACCEWLDGMPCYGDSTGLEAHELMKRAVEADSEDLIWAELSMFHSVWIEGHTLEVTEAVQAVMEKGDDDDGRTD